MRTHLLRTLVLCTTALMLIPKAATAQAATSGIDPAFGLETLKLWEGKAPGALGDAPDDVPTLTVFPTQKGKGNGTAIIIAPGGGYLGLASNLEGRQIADWFNARGVTAFVLKYRLGARYLYPTPLVDAKRAVRLVRSLAASYKFSSDRIGMIGFSAGGHLTAMTSTTFDAGKADAADPVERQSSRPDFVVLGYPWLSAMQKAKPTFIPSYQTLMKIPDAEAGAYEAPYTPLFHVSRDTPPTFIFITTDDHTVPVEASVAYYGALQQEGVSAELHVFQHGSHGVGLGSGDPALDLWPVLLEAWLRGRGLLAPTDVHS